MMWHIEGKGVGAPFMAQKKEKRIVFLSDASLVPEGWVQLLCVPDC